MVRSQAPLAPRKVPSQERSRATVEAIVQAATYILTEHGWEGLTTNAIAVRAGVNVGSLYRFFPNKEAIVAELQRRHAVTTRSDLRKALELLPVQPSLNSALTLIVKMLIDEHRVAPAVHKAISEELPRALRGTTQDTERMRKEFAKALRPFMKNVPDPELAIYVIGVSAHAVIHSVTADRPELLQKPRLISELVALLENYLRRAKQ